MNIAKFKAFPVMGIVRGIDAVAIEPLVETVIRKLKAPLPTSNFNIKAYFADGASAVAFAGP
jgi:hypothetical protein